MKKHLFVPTALALACSTAIAEERIEHRHMEEVRVFAVPFEDAISETMIPVNVVTGDELVRKVGNSLGDSLSNEPGIHSASFGTGVGQPVIRGFTGSRVQVLQGGLAVSDASAISPDHANGVDPLLADRIEVLRGPSTLLYGNGAIGGVVNVVDGRIPESLSNETTFIGEQAYDSVNGENRTLVRVDTAIGNVAFHIDGVVRDNDNVEIPGLANMDPDAEDNTNGFIGNSFGEGESIHGGFSLIGEKGFIGFSAGRIASNYGLPPGVHEHDHGHGHGDEDHDENHAEDHDEDHDHEHGEEEEVAIRLDMEKTRYDMKAHYDFDGEFLQGFDGQISFTDYEHSELEIEGDEVEVGTTYTNKGVDSRFTINHGTGAWDGVIGVQFGSSEFSAVGEEAYILPADISDTAIFALQRLDGERLDWEFGARIQQVDVDPTGACDSSDTATSFSASGQYQLFETSDLLISLSSSERAPRVEELYSNITGPGCTRPGDNEELVLHAATDLLEVGNPNLGSETSNNIDVGFRHTVGSFNASVNIFYNEIDNYIYLAEEGEFEGEMIATYQGQDATFKGFEVALGAQLMDLGFGIVEAEVFGDVVRAQFASGEYVPRIPPVRIGGELSLTNASTSAGLSFVQAFDQNRVGEDETRTDGFTRLGAYVDHKLALAGGEVTLFLRGDNLLDEDIRNHVSLLKEAVPEPGRSVRAGVRVRF